MTETPKRMRPLFLIKPATMSRTDIRRAERLCGIVIIECKEPDVTRLLEPPVDADVDAQARAALGLMRMVIATQGATYSQASFTKSQLLNFFLDQLMNAPKPRSVPVVDKAK